MSNSYLSKLSIILKYDENYADDSVFSIFQIIFAYFYFKWHLQLHLAYSCIQRTTPTSGDHIPRLTQRNKNPHTFDILIFSTILESLIVWLSKQLSEITLIACLEAEIACLEW